MRIATVMVVLAAAAALALAGCGGGGVVQAGSADLTRGKQLFQEKCGSCHTLADAGTVGTIGPNLDDAFAASRAQGFHEDTFVNVVREQIAFPGIGSAMPPGSMSS